MTVRSGLEPYRILAIQDHVVPNEYLSGDTTLEQIVGGMWELRQRLRDPARKFMDIFDNTGQPVYLNKKVAFEGGYAADRNHKLVFNGWISQCTPEFTDDGQTFVTITARDSGLLLGKMPRSVTYGAKVNTKSKTSDRSANVVESSDPADDRTWVSDIVADQGYITLRQIFEGVIENYGYEAVYKGPEDIRFGGDNHTELHQKNETDLQFLNRIGRSPNYDDKLVPNEPRSPRYNCQLYQDPANRNRWYFVERGKIARSNASDITFYYPSIEMYQPYSIDPLSSSAELPMKGVSLTVDGNKVAVAKPMTLINPETNEPEIIRRELDEDGVLKTYVLDESKLSTSEAQEFASNFDMVTSKWEDVKQFWIVRQEERNAGDDSDSVGSTRKVTNNFGWKLSFSTFGCVYVSIGLVYPILNIDPYHGNWSCIKAAHTIGSSYNLSVDMTKDS